MVFLTLPQPHCPLTIFQGETDEVVEPQAVYDWRDRLKPPLPPLIRFESTTHFFSWKAG